MASRRQPSPPKNVVPYFCMHSICGKYGVDVGVVVCDVVAVVVVVRVVVWVVVVVGVVR